MVNCVIAYPYYEIEDKAKELESLNEYHTVQAIDNWVEDKMEYKFFWDQRGLHKTTKDWLGDCTDVAVMKSYMLNYIGYETRLVHGFANGFIMHDWYEVRINGVWETPDEKYFENLRKIGYGLW